MIGFKMAILLTDEELQIIENLKTNISTLTPQDSTNYIINYVNNYLSASIVGEKVAYLAYSGPLSIFVKDLVAINNDNNEARNIELNAHDYASQIALSDSNYVLIDQTQAGRILGSTQFRTFLEQSNLDLSVFGDIDTFLYIGSTSLFGIASANCANQMNGDIYTITPFASPNRVFASVELKNILDNSAINSINDIPIEIYRNAYNVCVQAPPVSPRRVLES
jgi:hypothetical protein